MSLRFGSVCSGIEGASVAWHPLGWRAAWIADVDEFANAVTRHHFPDVPNLGDMTRIAARVLAGEVEAPDVLVGGTPCQAFSVAGMRQGLEDARGQLTISFVELADAIDHVRIRSGKPPVIIVWENVPGVLSDRGNAFGSFLGAIAGEDCELQPSGKRWTDAGCVYGPERAAAWRILDAQYFRLAQRRRRVFVVASARDGFDPAAVLFEREGLRRDTTPRREARTSVAALTANGVGTCGADDNQGQTGHLIAGTLMANGKAAGSATSQDAEAGYLISVADCSAVSRALTACKTATGRLDPNEQEFIAVTHALRAEGFDASEDGTGRGTPLVPVAFDTYNQTVTGDVTQTICSRGDTPGGNAHLIPAVCHAFDARQSDVIQYGDMTGPLDTDGHSDAVSVALRGREGGGTAELSGAVAGALRASQGGGDKPHVLTAVGFQSSQSGVREVEAHATLDANNGSRRHNGVMTGSAVRRLTPRECERLQGFPDDYTLVPLPLKSRQTRVRWAADGPRYKSLGNSFPVPVVRWIGGRIELTLQGGAHGVS